MSHRQEEINREAWRIQCEEEARQRKANGPEAQPPPEKPSRESAHSNVTAVALDEFLSLDIPPREIMLAPWLPRCGLAMIHAPRGLGKTQVAIGTTWAMASGGGFLRWTCENAWRVLFLDGEMPGADLQARFKSVIAASQFDLADPTYLKIAAADLMPEGLPDLSDPEVPTVLR